MSELPRIHLLSSWANGGPETQTNGPRHCEFIPQGLQALPLGVRGTRRAPPCPPTTPCSLPPTSSGVLWQSAPRYPTSPCPLTALRPDPTGGSLASRALDHSLRLALKDFL